MRGKAIWGHRMFVNEIVSKYKYSTKKWKEQLMSKTIIALKTSITSSRTKIFDSDKQPSYSREVGGKKIETQNEWYKALHLNII